MELRHLRYFIAVAEELNFSKAALRLYTAQPSLSQQIKDLEEEIGVKLFHRTKRKVELTEEGAVFLEQARLTIAQADRAVHLTQQAHLSKQRILKIGFLTAAEIRIFPTILPSFRVQYPHFKIEFSLLGDAEQHQALKNAELDIIFTRQKVNHKTVVDQVIFKDELSLILPKNHPLAQRETIPLEALKTLDFIMPTSPTFLIMNQVVHEFTQSHQINLNVQKYAKTIIDSLTLINSGEGCSILPKYVDPFGSLPNVTVRPFDVELPTLDIVMSYRQDDTSTALKSFLTMLNSILDQHTL
ncbi:DNA-binding transcriptional regulator HcaR [Acinetobacter apis]|uniref:LysR family transcriptional regulator, hca operon transcriptional activator n=1 Tax=Acinetobacter apis TaxID=1229165 RepID=A0A217EG32_9GAMM|nr:LysR substrate-binding domain-containing protein [Acinetobacter apis]SNQ29443.1 LysR family transcriptional regulator, hca operon transcriptional activator [Acinetobacter apis]